MRKLKYKVTHDKGDGLIKHCGTFTKTNLAIQRAETEKKNCKGDPDTDVRIELKYKVGC